ncbi:MAG: DUF977 family protein [Candidatus Thiodiazotropha sp. (ex Cardiolucina cf. quadrata)]|nr:DUF977 family protein [Candidatus Thiodiazotropha sp. (ex Cardiolucina cf. quadrata)]
MAPRGTQGTTRTDTPDWQPWVMYFLRALQKQKVRLETKIVREKILLDKLTELSVKILEIAKAHGRLTIGQIVEIIGANRNTVKKHLKSLVTVGHLSQHGTGKGTWYGRV